VTLALGLALGAGILLVISPKLWPRSRAKSSAAPSRMRDRLVQAGLGQVSIALVIAVAFVLAAAAATLVLATVGVVPLAIAAGLVALLLPPVLISWRARARRRATRIVWPDIVDQLVSGVRSGLALPDSVIVLAQSGPSPTREPFARFAEEYRVTGNFSRSIDGLKRALADPVADRILETLRMSREVGGTELTTVLRNLGIYLRQENAMRAELEARQSWVVNGARLGVAAPWVVLLLLATRPEAAVAYNSTGGATLILLGLLVSVVAYRVMIGLGRLPEERRWFA
jgi:tight adherence protein B